MLSNFFSKTPLWQHAEAAQRVLGVAELAADAPELLTLLADAAPEVRAAAIAKCTHIEALLGRMGVESEFATSLRARIIGLLAGMDEAQRDALLPRLGDEPEMIALATDAPTAALRMAAAQRVRTREGLRALQAATRNRDHGVAKYAKEKEEAMENAASRQTEAETICTALEELVGSEASIVSAVVDLDKRYAALQPDAPAAERFALARQAVQARFDREQAEQRERAAWLRDFDALRVRQQTSEMSQATLEASRADYAALAQRAHALPDLLDKLQHSGAKTAIELLEKTLAAQGPADELLLAFAPAVESSAKLVEFEDRWNAIPLEGRDPVRQQRFDDLLSGHRHQFAAKNAQSVAGQGEARQKLHTLLAQAEEALTNGEVQQAANLRDAMKPLRAEAGELPKPTNQRLGRLSQQLGDLLRWQAFGNATQREEMCVQAEAIPAQGLSVTELAKAVQALRDQWKQLDQTQAPAPRALWERFNAAAEKAYAPAAEHFAQLATQRKEALDKREAFCKDAEDYATLALTPADGQTTASPDWKAIGAWLSKAEATWRTLGHVDRRKIESIEARWKAATAPLREGVRGAQSGESAERDKLIAKVKGLINADGKLAGGAVAAVKDAQTQWQTRAKSFPLPRKQEQAMWETFRTACNTVFDTLGAEKTARSAAFGDAGSKKDALIAEYTTLATSGDEKAIRAAINDAPKRWATTGDAGREGERKLADKFDRALRSLRDTLRDRERNKGKVQLDTLLKVEAGCAVLDAAVAGGAFDETAWAEQWAIVDQLPPAWKQKMLARKDAASRARAAGGDAATIYTQKLDKTAAARATALLDLEISAGIDSPGANAQSRMQRQVAKLAERLKSGGVTLSLTEQVLAWCASPGKTSDDDQARIARVVAASGRTN
jgi:predicted transcriptional regulator